MATIAEILEGTRRGGCTETLSAELWLAFLLGKDRQFVFLNPTLELNKKIERRYWQGITELAEGKPLAQLTGLREFYGLPIVVNEDVLIPRPESELLVEMACAHAKKHYPGRPFRVADIGTGSGAILLAVLKNMPNAEGIGTDISQAALRVASCNAEKLGLAARVQWREGDLLLPVDRPCQIVLANLPYIGTERFNFVSGNVARYEPAMALYGGTDGLDLYQRFFAQLTGAGWFPELLVGEFGFGQQSLMEELLWRYFPQRQWRIMPDLAGIPRVFVLGS